MIHRQINYPLYIGVLLTTLLVAVAIIGPSLAPYDPLKEMGVITAPDGQKYGPPDLNKPLPPFRDPRFPLGLDETTRDVYSRLLIALRPTLLLCSIIMAARIGIGVVVGLLAGWFHRRVGPFVDTLISVSVAIPMLIVAIITITAIGIQRGVITFLVALTITGWCETATLVKNQTRTVLNAPYIESARAIGRGSWGILWQHILPQLRPVLPVLVAFELSAALLVVAELGYLNYYVGGGDVFVWFTPTGQRVQYLTPGYPELGQMLSGFFRQLYRTPWVSFFAGTVVALTLAAFTLLGEGLRRRLDVTQAQRVRRRWWFSRTTGEISAAEEWLKSGGGGLGPRRRPLPVGWAVFVIAAALISVGAYREFIVRPAAGAVRSSNAQFAQGGQPNASTPPTSTRVPVSTLPVAVDQLNALDPAALLFQAGDLPENFTVWQTSQRVPDQFRKVPQAAKVATVYFNRDGINSGSATLLLYTDTVQRDQAFDVMRKDDQSDLPDQVIGEKTLIFRAKVVRPDPRSTFGVPRSGYLLFARCGAVVNISLGNVSGPEYDALLAEYAQKLDARLAPLVCAPGDGPQAVSSAQATSVPAQSLDALDLAAIAFQAGDLPDQFERAQMSNRAGYNFASAPPPAKAIDISFNRDGITVGGVTVLVYPSNVERDDALNKLEQARRKPAGTVQRGTSRGAPTIAPQPAQPFYQVQGMGERGLSRDVVSVTGNISNEVAFTRCAAVVLIRLSELPGATGTASVPDLARAYAKKLDGRLGAALCGPQ